MSKNEIVIVGSGPAGTRAALTLVRAGLRPIVIDEASANGGQIYRRPPTPLARSPKEVYGRDWRGAARLHHDFDSIAADIDYRPDTTVWAAEGSTLHTVSREVAKSVTWDQLILATGTIDWILPFPGWTLPGVYSLGGAQVALKYQSCVIGTRPIFYGTGPLLYLVAAQYAASGTEPVALLDTTSLGAKLRAFPRLLSGGSTFLKGLHYLTRLWLSGVPVFSGVHAVVGVPGPDGAIAQLTWRDQRGRPHSAECDAVGFGFGLRSETQIAELCGLKFGFEHSQRQWLPELDGFGRGSVPGIYVAGDGALIRGAANAELSGDLAARTLLFDQGRREELPRMRVLARKLRRSNSFREALNQRAFPFPYSEVKRLPEDVTICRCEGVSLGEIRYALTHLGAAEINRVKSFCRIGMGRCQGRICGPSAAELIASILGQSVEQVGRLRAQAPVKPLPLAALSRHCGS
jgi:NADPH-dependent 2,4-dienoyl-CoA reductase/sulfur reductase-like enzyme